ncbi:general odorant-binding protein 56d-like [Arctopsyche grandis]|uniref:general odorant-binding protein 56d-like n=1 Tax=Arctopsyche grandis TaxID=121162 RepID=UPI00406D7E58
MRLYILLVALGMLVNTQGYTEEQQKKLKEHVTVCIGGTGANVELVSRARAGDFSFEDDKVKSYVFCVLKRIGLMDNEGVFKKEVALAKLDERKREPAGKAIDNCVSQYNTEGAPAEQLAWNYLKCYQILLPGNPII